MPDWFATVEFRQPELLWLVLVAIPIFFLSNHAPGRLVFSSLALIPSQQRGLRERLAWLPDALLALAVVFLTVALAGPRIGERYSRIHREGIAIMMVMDISGSMQALDLSTEDGERTRLMAVQDVFESFVLGGDGLPGRPDDAIGLVNFAGYADTAVPLTLDHENLTAIARDLEIVSERSEDGTAIGDALGLAVERLRGSQAESRIAVLLTDGVHNAGVESPAAAAELARSMAIKVYTIGAGTTGLAPVRTQDPFTGRSVLRAMAVEVDETTLKEIAERTDGRFFRATDAEGLQDVYAEIDRLTRSSLTEERFRQFYELFTIPLAIGLALAAIGWVSRGGLLVRLP
jgi:Ca-activated chloride channel family protein|tara:strand:- start:8251 stop:9288 length:1038 start_codon:yes stop_codon:yes gene_type:complete